MKKPILMMLLLIGFTLTIQSANAQAVQEPWPGVTIKVLTENDNVKVFKVTFAKGAVADWHSHPQYTAYAVTKVKMKSEEKGKEPAIVELQAGQGIWSPAVTHKTTSMSKKRFTLIVTEIK